MSTIEHVTIEIDGYPKDKIDKTLVKVKCWFRNNSNNQLTFQHFAQDLVLYFLR